jgi:hypothetical protein
MTIRFWAALVLAGVAGLQTASAGLIIETFEQFSGTGLGAVPTVLTFQNNPSESGCVSFGNVLGSSLSATGACTGSDADVKHGQSQTKTQTLGSAGIASASDFALIFNAVEPAGGPLSVTSLTAAFYSTTGTLLYETSGLFCQTTAGGPIVSAGGSGCLLTQTAQGTGNSGFLVTLTPDQALAAAAAGVFQSSTIVGVSSSATGSAGGSETIFLANGSGVAQGPQPTPEPATYALIGCGLIGLGWFRLRRRA